MTDTANCSELANLTEATQIIVCVASGFSWTTLLSPAIIAVSAIIAWRSLNSARELARKKATLDLIEKVESSSHYRQMHSTFAYYRNMKRFPDLHNPTEDKDRRDRTDVQDYLNHYELVSIGIEEGILDEGFYKRWMKGPFVRDWNAAADYIQRERWKKRASGDWYYHDALYEAYQRVATSFDSSAITLTDATAPPPENAEGPGDEPIST